LALTDNPKAAELSNSGYGLYVTHCLRIYFSPDLKVSWIGGT